MGQGPATTGAWRPTRPTVHFEAGRCRGTSCCGPTECFEKRPERAQSARFMVRGPGRMATLIEIRDSAPAFCAFGFETLQLPEIVSFTTLRKTNGYARTSMAGAPVGRAYLATIRRPCSKAAAVRKGGEHLAKRVGMAGDQQAPAGLRGRSATPDRPRKIQSAVAPGWRSQSSCGMTPP